MDRPRVFRPTLDIWIGRAVLPPIFVCLFSITATNLVRGDLVVLMGVLTLLLFFLILWLPEVNALLMASITVDRQGLSFRQMGAKVRVTWGEVRAVLPVKRDGRTILLATEANVYSIPIEFFSSDHLWKTIQELGPQAAFGMQAKTYLEHRIVADNQATLVLHSAALLVTENRGLQVVTMVGVLVMLVFSLQGLAQGLKVAMLFYVAFGILYLFNSLECGTIEFDREGVTRRNLLGVTRICWDEVRYVEASPLGVRFSLEGENGHRLVMFGIPLWTGPEAVRAAQYFGAQLASRQLEVRRSWLPLIKISRGARA